MASQALSIKDWFEGLKSPGGALATRSESRAKAAGHAAVGVIEGGLVGLATGVAGSLLPGGLSSKQLGVGAIAAGIGAAAMATKPLGRHLSNVSVGLAAIAMHEHSGNKAAAAAGTSSAVLTNKAKAIAAHGDDADESLNAGEDPLVTLGSEIFR